MCRTSIQASEQSSCKKTKSGDDWRVMLLLTQPTPESGRTIDQSSEEVVSRYRWMTSGSGHQTIFITGWLKALATSGTNYKECSFFEEIIKMFGSCSIHDPFVNVQPNILTFITQMCATVCVFVLNYFISITWTNEWNLHTSSWNLSSKSIAIVL